MECLQDSLLALAEDSLTTVLDNETLLDAEQQKRLIEFSRDAVRQARETPKRASNAWAAWRERSKVIVDAGIKVLLEYIKQNGI